MEDVMKRFEDEYPEAGQTLATVCTQRAKKRGRNKPLFLDAIQVQTETKIGRNDPCTCGSNKKYKKCCG